MINIKEKRLKENLFKQGEIGWIKDKGLVRPGNSEAFLEARSFVQSVMNDAGFSTRLDGVGNLFGIRKGSTPSEGTILAGSHMDSVSGGGIYDGPLGVLGAVEAITSIIESGYVPRHNIEVVAFNFEEGGPLGGTFGSRAFSGQVKDAIDPGAISESGLKMEDLKKSRELMSSYKAYLELHIEQGPVLWKKKIPVGIPTAIVSIVRYKVTIKGEANHAGTTPMAERKDAVAAMSRVLSRWFDYMEGYTDFVCNVGDIKVDPGQVNVVPGRVEFVLELRSHNEVITDKAAEKFQEILNSMNSCSGSMELTVNKPPVLLDDRIINQIEKAASEEEITSIRMPSGASHDASAISHVMSTGMIFVPSVRGISHSMEEFTDWSDLVCGVRVLAASIIRLDKLF